MGGVWLINLDAKEAIVACFKALSQNMFGGAEKNYRKASVRKPGFWVKH
jgi:hypothetical protein